MRPVPLDYSATSERPAWASLPTEVRQGVAAICGSSIASAAPPVRSGFTGSYAGVLTLDGGRRVFVKGSGPALPHVVTALAREADVLPQLGELNCAPRLLGSSAIQTRGEGDWRVLVLDLIDGVQPGDPWCPGHPDAVAAACVDVARIRGSRACAITTASLGEEIGEDEHALTAIDELVAGRVGWPDGIPAIGADARRDLARLAAKASAALHGDALVHSDLRPDNLLIERGGQARIVDWNWVMLGPPWVDLAGLFPFFAWGGVDIRPYAALPLFDGVPADDVDAFFAILVGYLIHGQDEQPPPGCTPALRAHQRFLTAACLDLLRARRDW